MNKPIGCTKCGGNDHNADECKRFAGELWAVHAQGPDDIYPAFDRADAERHAAELNAIPTPAGVSVAAVVIPSPMSPLEHWKELAEQEREHKAQVIASAAQPAPVVPDKCADMNHHERYRAGWNACRAAMLAAAPAQGQQVDDYKAWYDEALEASNELGFAGMSAAQVIRYQAEELSALKAQQVGKEPQRCQCCGYLITESEHRGCLRAAAPQPAPSQDVAGLASSDPVAKAEFETRLRKEFESRWPKPKGVTWGAGINDYCVSEFAEGIALSYPDMWMAYKAGAMRTNQ